MVRKRYCGPRLNVCTVTGPETTLVLRALQPEDLAAVMDLERALFQDEAWTVGMLREEMADPSRAYFAAEQDGEVVGYAGVCIYDAEAFVQTIGVRADRQRRGIGRALLVQLLELADARRLPVLLEVRADNVAAQALYAEHGFAPIGLRRGYYQPSGTDAVVMRREAVR